MCGSKTKYIRLRIVMYSILSFLILLTIVINVKTFMLNAPEINSESPLIIKDSMSKELSHLQQALQIPTVSYIDYNKTYF